MARWRRCPKGGEFAAADRLLPDQGRVVKRVGGPVSGWLCAVGQRGVPDAVPVLCAGPLALVCDRASAEARIRFKIIAPGSSARDGVTSEP